MHLNSNDCKIICIVVVYDKIFSNMENVTKLFWKDGCSNDYNNNFSQPKMADKYHLTQMETLLLLTLIL